MMYSESRFSFLCNMTNSYIHNSAPDVLQWAPITDSLVIAQHKASSSYPLSFLFPSSRIAVYSTFVFSS